MKIAFQEPGVFHVTRRSNELVEWKEGIKNYIIVKVIEERYSLEGICKLLIKFFILSVSVCTVFLVIFVQN